MFPCSQSTHTQSAPARARHLETLAPGIICHSPNVCLPSRRAILTLLSDSISALVAPPPGPPWGTLSGGGSWLRPGCCWFSKWRRSWLWLGAACHRSHALCARRSEIGGDDLNHIKKDTARSMSMSGCGRDLVYEFMSDLIIRPSMRCRYACRRGALC
ncbi:hypothetical protein LIA77_02764 [Sarocladium implicatum]|nr:hypothetical protein LIA77_02764 [Sarocladium implicatum]